MGMMTLASVRRPDLKTAGCLELFLQVAEFTVKSLFLNPFPILVLEVFNYLN